MKGFSKSKFIECIERTVLSSDNNIDAQANGNEIIFEDAKKWGFNDFHIANISQNTSVGSGDWYAKWLYQIDYVADGIVKPEHKWNYIKKKINENAINIAKNESFCAFIDNHRIGLSRQGLEGPKYWYKGKLLYYHLTNLDISAFNDYEPEISLEMLEVLKVNSTIFSNESKEYFQVGFGCPEIFMNNKPDYFIKTIREIENNPDELIISYFNDNCRIQASNQRKYSIWDKKRPKHIYSSQFVENNSSLLECFSEFEHLINKSLVNEIELQKFLESNQEFLYSLGYDAIYPQLTLVDDDGRILKPDFFLKPIDSNLWDILDIKLPSIKLIVGKNNREHFAYSIRKGISQLHEYSDFFENPRNREKVYKETGIECFQPRLSLVIGKTDNIDISIWDKLIQRESDVINILTFEDMLMGVNGNI